MGAAGFRAEFPARAVDFDAPVVGSATASARSVPAAAVFRRFVEGVDAAPVEEDDVLRAEFEPRDADDFFADEAGFLAPVAALERAVDVAGLFFAGVDGAASPAAAGLSETPVGVGSSAAF